MQEISNIDTVHFLTSGHWHYKINLKDFKKTQSEQAEVKKFFHDGKMMRASIAGNLNLLKSNTVFCSNLKTEPPATQIAGG